MPFKSKAQQRFMFAKHPEIAKEFADKTPDISKLPEHLAEGGVTAGNPSELDPGVKDATVSDFLLPLIGGSLAGKAAETAVPALEGLGEAGEISIGRAAPKMEEAAMGETPKIEAYIKGIQKGMKGSPDVKIWGVKGAPEEIAKLGFGKDPGSIPEHILRAKGVLPESIDVPQNAPHAYSEGGTVKNYADGGDVTTNDGDWQDKLKSVLDAMGMGAKAAVAPLMPSPAAPTTPAPAALNPAGATAPIIPAPPAPVETPAPQAASMPPVPQTPAAQAAPAPAKPAAVDLLSKLTDNDSTKMSALLASLKDQDKRSRFAQALGVIGDTFGNMGMAKAGQRPEGFTTPQMLAGMNKESKESQLQNLTQTLAADPNSQTSKMAQATLMQAMGIKPGDPREARIRAMPAMTITQMMPQLNESVKIGLEREKNLIESKKADIETQNQSLARQTAAANAAREQRQSETTAAADLLKNTSVFNRPAQNMAEETLQRNLGTGTAQGAPLTATNKMGHRIQSTDGGRTWHPIQ
jgi:hypothetical protein